MEVFWNNHKWRKEISTQKQIYMVLKIEMSPKSFYKPLFPQHFYKESKLLLHATLYQADKITFKRVNNVYAE